MKQFNSKNGALGIQIQSWRMEGAYKSTDQTIIVGT